MRLDDWHAHAEFRPFSRSIALQLFKRESGTISILSNFVMQSVPEYEILPEPQQELLLPTETAQELMDALWQCGLRPSEGSGSAGALAATQTHLKDALETKKRLLDMVEKNASASSTELGLRQYKDAADEALSYVMENSTLDEDAKTLVLRALNIGAHRLG